MKNAKITDIGNGFFRIVPYKNFTLYHKATGRYYSEAETRDVSQFESKRKK